MDMRTGEIADLAEFERRGTPKKFLREIASGGTMKMNDGSIVNAIDPKNLSKKVLEMIVGSGKSFITRNSRCPCGSGKRFKRCCMMKDE